MADPFQGEIRMMSFNFPPLGWAMCNGQQLPINQHEDLWSLLGTTYGGNGQTTFALPNLRGRVPIHAGAGFTQGQAGGAESHTLTINELPAHTHLLPRSGTRATSAHPDGMLLAESPEVFGPGQANGMNPGALTSVGGSQPHSNMQPYFAINFCIALVGDFPARD